MEKKKAPRKKSDMEKFYGLFPEKALAEDLLNILEDYRIEGRLKGEYPALKDDMEEMNKYFLSKRPAPSSLESDKSKAVEHILQRLMLGSGESDVPELKEAAEYALEVSKPLWEGSSGVHDTARAAAKIYSFIDERFRDPYVPIEPMTSLMDQGLVEETVGNFGRAAEKLRGMIKDGEGMSLEGLSAEELMELLKRLFREKGLSPKDLEGGLEGLPLSELQKYLEAMLSEPQKGREVDKEAKTFLYPEWGSDINDYRPDWAKVFEVKSDETDSLFYSETMRKHNGLIKNIRREFQAIKPDSLRKLKKQLDGEELDYDACVEYFVDRKLKDTPSEKVYTRKERKQRDVSVAFLIDMSGSTSGYVSSRQSIIDCEKEALVVMSEAMEEIGDDFAIYGFSGGGRDQVDFYTIKDFDETHGENVRRRISSIHARSQNRDGTAVRHTTSKLRKRDSKTKLLILISDGEPADNEYSGDYAIADTRVALKEAQKAGLKTFCVTVQRDVRRYVPDMYTHSNYVVIDNVEKLPEKLTRIYRKLTT